MEMFLMVAVMSLLGVAVCAVLFAAATRGEQPVPRTADEPRERAPQRFFAAAPSAPKGVVSPLPPRPEAVPVEALLLQLEQHIRLEQAAAESFLHTPTGQSLKSRTASPLLH